MGGGGGAGMSTGPRPPVRPRSADAAGGVGGLTVTSKICSPQLLVESGLLDVAAGIFNVACSLTDLAITSIKSTMSERGRRASRDEVEFLREAIFHGIAQQLIERADRKVEDEPQKQRTNISSSPPTTIATTVAPLRPALVTIPAACAYLNVSKSTFYERVLPNLEIVHLLSSKPLIKLDSLDRLIAAKTVAPRATE